MFLVKTITGIAAGLVCGFLLLIGVELASAVLYPFPEGFDGSQAATCHHVENYPAWVLAIVVPMWGATAFASAWVALKLGNWLAAGVIGLLLLSMLALNQWMLPYPIWFEVANFLVMPLAMAIVVWRSLPFQADESEARESQ